MNTKQEIEMSDNYVSFGDIARSRLGQQCQYASRYIDGAMEGWANLGEGLRFTGFDRNGNINNYHAMKIHRDDIEEFVRRWQEHTNLKG